MIEVDVQGRLKDGGVYTFIREALAAAYGSLDKPVALGGVFVLTESNGRFHVLVGYISCVHAFQITRKSGVSSGENTYYNSRVSPP